MMRSIQRDSSQGATANIMQGVLIGVLSSSNDLIRAEEADRNAFVLLFSSLFGCFMRMLQQEG